MPVTAPIAVTTTTATECLLDCLPGQLAEWSHDVAELLVQPPSVFQVVVACIEFFYGEDTLDRHYCASSSKEVVEAVALFVQGHAVGKPGSLAQRVLLQLANVDFRLRLCFGQQGAELFQVSEYIIV